MADQQERTNHENTKRESAYDPLMDTQRLLLGVEPPAEDDFRLEDILAEYGGRSRPASDAPEGKDPAPPGGSPAGGGVKKLPRLRLNFPLSSFEWRCLVRHFTI